MTKPILPTLFEIFEGPRKQPCEFRDFMRVSDVNFFIPREVDRISALFWQAKRMRNRYFESAREVHPLESSSISICDLEVVRQWGHSVWHGFYLLFSPQRVFAAFAAI